MLDINLYPSERGPFDFRYGYDSESRVLTVSFRDKSTFTQTPDFAIKCPNHEAAVAWLNDLVMDGIDPDAHKGTGLVGGSHIPALVAKMHKWSNRNHSLHTAWFAGSFSVAEYSVMHWEDFAIDLGEASTAHAIPVHIQQQLGYYVYALRDPRDRKVFYIGKGTGNRILQHVAEAGEDTNAAAESQKLATIQEIESSGHSVEHLFIRYGLEDEATAFIVEQAVIDAFRAAGLDLDNQVKGHHSEEFGLASLDAVLAKYGADPLPRIDQPIIMLKINRLWKSDMSPVEVMDATHGYWKIGPDSRELARYALGIAFGIVRGVYRIGRWHESTIDGHENRWWFEAQEAPEMQHLIGKHVKDAFVPGSSNPYQKYLEGYQPKN